MQTGRESTWRHEQEGNEFLTAEVMQSMNNNETIANRVYANQKQRFRFRFRRNLAFYVRKVYAKKKGFASCGFQKNILVATMSNLPWRTERGPILTTCLLKLVVSTGQHMKKNKAGNPDIWESFSDLLFKQPEFHGLEGSANSIYSQFQETLAKRARHHGWKDENGGVTGNLSGHEGDLDDLDTNVKQILMDREE
jgi:hypothetical protein